MSVRNLTFLWISLKHIINYKNKIFGRFRLSMNVWTCQRLPVLHTRPIFNPVANRVNMHEMVILFVIFFCLIVTSLLKSLAHIQTTSWPKTIILNLSLILYWWLKYTFDIEIIHIFQHTDNCYCMWIFCLIDSSSFYHF